jgi:hypothetical protein
MGVPLGLFGWNSYINDSDFPLLILLAILFLIIFADGSTAEVKRKVVKRKKLLKQINL